MAKYDVEDCFLNTSRDEVVAAVIFWLEATPRRTRQQAYFAISKDCKAADHRGRSYSLHFWELSALLMLAVVGWELEETSCFEALGDGDYLVLQRRKGLPSFDICLPASCLWRCLGNTSLDKPFKWTCNGKEPEQLLCDVSSLAL